MRTNTKYEFVEGDTRHAPVARLSWGVLKRIRALRDIPSIGVKAGDLGGYIENRGNLSEDGNAWVFENALVFDEAFVRDDAWIGGSAYASGNAGIYGAARVYDQARVGGHARVYDRAQVFLHAKVGREAKVYGDACVYDSAEVLGDARVYDNARVCGHAQVSSGKQICGDETVFVNGRGKWIERGGPAAGDPVGWCLISLEGAIVHGLHEKKAHAEQYLARYATDTLTPLYTRPANVAALEARVRELERCEKDAARFRWLVENVGLYYGIPGFGPERGRSPEKRVEDLLNAIDANIERSAVAAIREGEEHV